MNFEEAATLPVALATMHNAVVTARAIASNEALPIDNSPHAHATSTGHHQIALMGAAATAAMAAMAFLTPAAFAGLGHREEQQ